MSETKAARLNRISRRGWCVLFLCLAWASNTLAQIKINEVMADNQTVYENGADFPDYIELYNMGASAVDLGGMSLTDTAGAAARNKFVFPANTMIPAGGFFLVYADDKTNSPGLHTLFGLSDKGDLVVLYPPGITLTPLDVVTFGLQLPDRSIGRVPDGTGAFTLNMATPGDPNEAIMLGGPSELRINEWMALATDSQGDVQDDWFEVYNATNRPVLIGGLFISDTSTNHMLRALSYIDALGFIEFKADDNAGAGADHVPFKLSSSNGETLRIYDRNGFTVLEEIMFGGGQQANVAQGRLPDAAPPPYQDFPGSRASPGESNSLLITNVWITEVLTHTDPPLTDTIELYNPTASPVNIGRWWISDDPSDPFRFQIPANTTIPPFEFIVFDEFDFNPTGTGIPPNFTFNSFEGEEVNLFAADATGKLTGYVLRQDFGAAINGVSFGRLQTSDGKDFVAMSQRSFGSTNPAPLISPIIISEVMYHPPDIIQGTNILDNNLDEYIELRSVTNGITRLYDPNFPTNTWRIREGVSFRFPEGRSLAPGECILLVNFDPQTNQLQRASFKSLYAVPDSVQIFGPYRGKLSNGGEGIELVRPDTPQGPGPNVGFVPYVIVERVHYNDRNHWPVAPDGQGRALQKDVYESYGNESSHWIAAPPTPGRDYTRIESSSIVDGTFSLQFQADPGASYSVLYRTNLHSGQWFELREIAAAASTRSVQVDDPNAGQTGNRFYRLVSPAQ